MHNEKNRQKLLRFLSWNDPNGTYLDEHSLSEGLPLLTQEEAEKYFYNVITQDLVITQAGVGSVIDLTHNEVIEVLEQNSLYKDSVGKLKSLYNEDKPTTIFFSTLFIGD